MRNLNLISDDMTIFQHILQVLLCNIQIGKPAEYTLIINAILQLKQNIRLKEYKTPIKVFEPFTNEIIIRNITI